MFRLLIILWLVSPVIAQAADPIVEATTAPALGVATVQDSLVAVDHSQSDLRRILFTNVVTDLLNGQGGWTSTAGTLLSLTSCPTPGQIPKWTGSAWGCAADSVISGDALPSGGAPDQILMMTVTGAVWIDFEDHPAYANIVTSEPPAE